MTSIEKLQQVLAGFRDAEPTDEADARNLAMLASIVPVALGHLPDDPAELDDLLLRGARWALQMRSDGAPLPSSYAELIGAQELGAGEPIGNGGAG